MPSGRPTAYDRGSRPGVTDGIRAVVAELASKHSLSYDTALEIMTDTLSASLTAKAGRQVVVSVSDGEVRVSFFEEGPFPDSKTKGLVGAFGRHIKSFLIDLETAFALHAAKEALVVFRPLIYRAVLGEVVNIDEKGGLTVEMENGGYADGKVAAYCDSSEVSKKERGKLCKADRRWFYVKCARVAYLHGLPRLEVGLSRRSKRLPVLLLTEELTGRGGCIARPRLRCVYRKAGVRSDVSSNVPIVRDILAKVGGLLGGEIIRVIS
jgi:hypothetical protein